MFNGLRFTRPKRPSKCFQLSEYRVRLEPFNVFKWPDGETSWSFIANQFKNTFAVFFISSISSATILAVRIDDQMIAPGLVVSVCSTGGTLGHNATVVPANNVFQFLDVQAH